MTDAERRVLEAAVDAYRGFYCTLAQHNLVNATRTLLGGEMPVTGHEEERDSDPR